MSLLFEHKVKGTDRNLFIDKVKKVGYMLGYDPEWLMFVMHNESRFLPDAVNPYSGATGLIQFMPGTAKWLGTSANDLKAMTREQQLDWVLKYYQKWKKAGKVARNSTDLALITFYPYAVNQPDDYKIGSEKSLERAKIISQQNPGLDIDKDGCISVLDYKKWLAYRLPLGLSKTKIVSIIGLKAAKISLTVMIMLGILISASIFHSKTKQDIKIKN